MGLDIEIKEDIFKYYFYWMSERMNVFWRRYENKPVTIKNNKDLFGEKTSIWTVDTILQNHKFTNVYRVLDRVSQYLVKDVIYTKKKYEPRDVVFRIILFKIFNKIETWEYLENVFGDITIETYNFKKFSQVLKDAEFPIFNNAYMMNAVSYQNTHIKHEKYFYAVEDFFFKKNYIEKILDSDSLNKIYNIIVSVPMLGNFIAYQYAIDVNYSDVVNFDENSFVVAGLGAQRGIDKCFEFDKKEVSYEDVIRYVADNVEKLREEYSNKFDMDLTFRPLPGREPTLIDLQNCFCETDKYTRGLGIFTKHTKRIKQKFKENNNKIYYFFPPKWKIEDF